MAKPNLLNSFLVLTQLVIVAGTILLIYHAFGESWKKSIAPVPMATSSGPVEEDPERVENGIHMETGLVYAEGFDLVRANCLACHSSKLILQNRASRAGWQQMIDWMQATQGLWDLGDKEPKIVDYLAEYYAPKEIGRRANLDLNAVEWYILDLEN